MAFMIGSPVLLQKTSMPLSFKNKKIGLVKNSLLPFDKTKVFIGNRKIFSLYNGSGCEYPMFIHPLDEGTRILCICANDTEDLVFVVDLNGSKTNTSTNLFWAPYLVMDTDALVRLPTKTELDEALDWLGKATDREYRKTSLPFDDFGLFRIYAGKNEAHFLLSNAPLNGSGVQPWISDEIPDVEVLGL